jgi:S-adenosylmethionine-diacylgycerolhomoserine-N-methlytransferase
MTLLADLRILCRLAFPRADEDDPGVRLEAFYHDQAEGYDDFRRRLLHGREEMMRGLELAPGARLLDMGGGTGSNLEYLDDRWDRLASVEVVDLCPALLRVARARVARRGWDKVDVVQGDATTYEPSGGPADAVTFSYSLTMMPDWFRAVDRAHALLRPGGMVGVADFYVARKWPAPGLRRHSAWQRWFWPWWFSRDNVFLSPDILPYLQSWFQTVRLEERLGRVPYLPGLKVPYYIFIGRRT